MEKGLMGYSQAHGSTWAPPAHMSDMPSLFLFLTEDEPILPEVPKCDPNVLDTTVVVPATWLSDTFRSVLTKRIFVSEFHNFLLGLQLHKDYLHNSQFSKWKGSSHRMAHSSCGEVTHAAFCIISAGRKLT